VFESQLGRLVILIEVLYGLPQSADNFQDDLPHLDSFQLISNCTT
jgi:hypothetical protein